MFEFLIKASFMSIYLSIYLYLNVPKIISKDAFNVNTFNRGISISFMIQA